jgi:hypothetical protein
VSKKKVDEQIEDALDLEKIEEPQDLVHNGDSAGGVPILPNSPKEFKRNY